MTSSTTPCWTVVASSHLHGCTIEALLRIRWSLFSSFTVKVSFDSMRYECWTVILLFLFHYLSLDLFFVFLLLYFLLLSPSIFIVEVPEKQKVCMYMHILGLVTCFYFDLICYFVRSTGFFFSLVLFVFLTLLFHFKFVEMIDLSVFVCYCVIWAWLAWSISWICLSLFLDKSSLLFSVHLCIHCSQWDWSYFTLSH